MLLALKYVFFFFIFQALVFMTDIYSLCPESEALERTDIAIFVINSIYMR